jgi:Flp pilus assembly pilin Flp
MGGRAVEGTGLENRQGCKLLVGSNPTPSARASRHCPTPLPDHLTNHQQNSGIIGDTRPIRAKRDMRSLLESLRAERGATAIEYAMVALLISIAAFSVIVQVGTSVSSAFVSIANGF